MNPRAIDDLLGTILSQWYGTVALWAAPGELSEATCALCRTGIVADVIDHTVWPHDLVHTLNGALESAATQITTSLAEEESGCPTGDHQCARELLTGTMMEHVPDILDVLRECVTGKLDRYVGLELERGMRELHRTPDTH